MLISAEVPINSEEVIEVPPEEFAPSPVETAPELSLEEEVSSVEPTLEEQPTSPDLASDEVLSE